MQHKRSDELAAELRSVRPRNERKLALNTGFAMWLVGSVGVLIASFALPDLVPQHIWIWRAGWTALSLAMAVSHVTWMKRLTPAAHYVAVVTASCVWVAVTAALMLVAPAATLALTINLLPPAMYGAFYFRLREMIAVLLFATAVAIFPVAHDYEAATAQHLISWLTVLIPVIWLLALVVTRQRRDRTIAAVAAEQQVFSDSLTGISNMRALSLRADEMLGATRTGDRVAALLLVDVDDLGTVNREYGHHAGDHVLRAVGKSLARAASGNHLVARVSGNVFAVLIESVAACDVNDVEIRYRNAVRGARSAPEIPALYVDANIGVAVHSSGAGSLEDLLTEADASLNAKKKLRGGRRPASSQQALPNEFRRAPSDFLPASADDDVEHSPDEPAGAEEGPRHDTGERGLLGRPDYAVLSGAGWFFAISIVLLSIAMPDADRSMAAVAVPYLLANYLCAALNLFFAPRIGSVRHLIHDGLTLSAIAVGAYLVGGSDGPGWLTIFVFIAYAGWFNTTRALLLRLIGPVLVILAPLAYENLGTGSAAAGTIATLYAGVVIACTLGLAMGYNRMYMERAHTTAEWLASLDPLTGLANRGAFERHLRELLETLPYQAEDALAIVTIDLNGFNRVNRERGYAAGDDLLVSIGASMRRSLRESDMLARIDGDEFAVVLQRAGAREAVLAAERLVGVIADGADNSDGKGQTAVSASAGFSLYPMHGRTLDELVNAADLALTTAKSGSQSKSRVSRLVMGL